MNKKTVLLLGANSDIAKETIKIFAEADYYLQLGLRNPSILERFKSDLEIRYQTNISLHKFDVLEVESHQTFIASLDPLPDVVVMAVGYLGDQKRAEKSHDERELNLQTNFNGPVAILSDLANKMEERGHGTIVGISSVAGDRGRASNYLYGSAKAGFTAFLSGLRNRLSKKGINVVTVIPGFVNTKMTEGLDLPPLITAQPEQVAHAIYQSVKKGKSGVLYSLKIWRLIMLVIKSIPEKIFQKLSL